MASFFFFLRFLLSLRCWYRFTGKLNHFEKSSFHTPARLLVWNPYVRHIENVVQALWNNDRLGQNRLLLVRRKTNKRFQHVLRRRRPTNGYSSEIGPDKRLEICFYGHANACIGLVFRTCTSAYGTFFWRQIDMQSAIRHQCTVLSACRVHTRSLCSCPPDYKLKFPAADIVSFVVFFFLLLF